VSITVPYNMKSVNQKGPFRCTKCPKHYWTKYRLKAHMNVSHGEVKCYRCYFCSLAIFTESHMIQHMSKHTKEKPYKCQYCYQWYRQEESVKRHNNGKSCSLKLMSPLLSPCYFCGKGFSTHQNLKVHMKTVHLKEDLKRCNLCCKHFSSTTAISNPKQYWTKCNLKAHMNVSHEDVKRHQCYFCSYTTCKPSVMIRHMSNHTKEKPHKCQYCNQWYKQEESVKKHKNGKSCNLKQKYPLLSPCYFCGTALSNHRLLRVHMTVVHLQEDSKHCNLCNKYFSSTSAINHHIRTVHLLEKNYKCQLCSKQLRSNTDLNQHIRGVHTKERPFKCYFCSKSFLNFDRLRRHVLIHTREKPLTCYFCRKNFSDLKELSAHIGKIHTKEHSVRFRAFQCIQGPSRCYSTKDALNLHVRRKHGSRIQQ
jgi:KRAB domain-containing zinc finger protein